ncbi:MAG: Imm26 family immunity protein [Armatimonadetes bacterium]|nr:Imm26 family immunity protein [Armatimonadota bacterium]
MKRDIDYYINEFADGLIQQWNGIMNPDSKRADIRKQEQRYSKAADKLTATEEGVAAFTKLLNHENSRVAGTAAVYLLETSAEMKAVECFREFAKGPEDEYAANCARLRLADWEKARQAKPVTLGDYFAIPLEVGGFAFGKVKDKYGRVGMLFDLLRFHSETIASMAVLRETPVLREFITDYDSLGNQSWPTLGNVPLANPPEQRTEKQHERERNATMMRLRPYIGSESLLPYIEQVLREANLLN